MAKSEKSKLFAKRLLIAGVLSLLVGILMFVVLVAVVPRMGTIRYILRDPVEALRSFWRAHKKEFIEGKDDRLKQLNTTIGFDHITLGHLPNDMRDLKQAEVMDVNRSLVLQFHFVFYNAATPYLTFASKK